MKNCLSIYLLGLIITAMTGCHMTIPEDEFNIRKRMVSGDSLHVYSTLDEPFGNNFNIEKTYHSVRFGKMRTLQGGIDGEPLQGVYELYFKKKLVSKGKYRNGLKNGEWFSWTVDGTLISVINYQSGVRQGAAREFDQNGKLKFVGKYKQDKLDGVAKIITGDELVAVKYRKGVLSDTISTESKLFKLFKKDKKSTEE